MSSVSIDICPSRAGLWPPAGPDLPHVIFYVPRFSCFHPFCPFLQPVTLFVARQHLELLSAQAMATFGMGVTLTIKHQSCCEISKRANRAAPITITV